MNIELRKQYNEHDEIFSIVGEITYSEEDEDSIESLVNNRFRDVPQALRRGFTTHKELYKLINEEKYKDDKYNPDGYYFYELDDGFKEFIKDMTESELQRLTNIYGDLVSEYLDYRTGMLTQQHKGRVSVGLQMLSENNIDLQKLDIQTPPILITEDKAYAFELKEMQNIDTLSSLKENVYNTIYEDLNNQAKVAISSYERKISKLKEMFEQEKNKLFSEILRNSKEIFMNWDFIEHEGSLYLKFKERIRTTKVIKNGIQYEYPGAPDFQELYVSGLKVKVVTFVRADDVSITRGKNLHFNGTHGCIGDLNGQPLFNVLKDLPKALEIANMDSPLNDSVSTYLRRNFLDGHIAENNIEGNNTRW
jgi:hypothetical protein